MKQSEFTRIFCERPEVFTWFLGAGASHNANLPTAEDIITDLKRRYYCSEENQTFKTKDLQNAAVRETVESYMQSRGFPERWAPDEYTTYFETIFGSDRERQRNYISGMLSEDRVRLAIGNRVFGALLASGLCRVAFTTNFDPVVETSVAKLSGSALSAFHLEGAQNAVFALNNEQYPIYCKLHGDFQYDSIKNLSEDLAVQNAELSDCLKIAASRFGFVVAGYSGRDESIIELFREALGSSNPFPHGLYWLKMKGSQALPGVVSLIDDAKADGVRADFVDIETFDTVMLRIWRNLPSHPEGMDEKVRKGRAGKVQIELPNRTGQAPILRLNALPVLGLPSHCATIKLKSNPTWEYLSDAQRTEGNSAITTFDLGVLAWGSEADFEHMFGTDYLGHEEIELHADWSASSKLQIKRFLEDGIARSFCKSRPLIQRRRGSTLSLIVDHKAEDIGVFQTLFDIVGKPTGQVPGLKLPEQDDQPAVDKVFFAESVVISLAKSDGRFWLLLKPDVWIWPAFARQHATDFLEKRRKNRRNDVYDRLVSAWIDILSDHAGKDVDFEVSPFEGDLGYLNPRFGFSARTGYALKRGRR